MKILGMGGFELVIILVVILLIFGPKNLPKLGSAIGKTVSNLRSGMNEGKKKNDADADSGAGADPADGDQPESHVAEIEGEVETVASEAGEAAPEASPADEIGDATDVTAEPAEASKKVRRVVKKKVSSD